MECPYCKEEIKDEAVKCRYCGEFLNETKPIKLTGLANALTALYSEKIVLTGAAVSFIALLPFPVGFYIFTRIVVSICAVIVSYRLYKRNESLWIGFALVAIIYNPIIPVYLYERSLWMVVNFTSGIMFLVHFKEDPSCSYSPSKNALIQLMNLSRVLFFCWIGVGAAALLFVIAESRRNYTPPDVEFVISMLIFLAVVLPVGIFYFNKTIFKQSSLWIKDTSENG